MCRPLTNCRGSCYVYMLVGRILYDFTSTCTGIRTLFIAQHPALRSCVLFYCFVFRTALRYCSSETPGGKRELPTWQSHVPAHLSAPNCAVSLPLCSKLYRFPPQQHRGFYLR